MSHRCEKPRSAGLLRGSQENSKGHLYPWEDYSEAARARRQALLVIAETRALLADLDSGDVDLEAAGWGLGRLGACIGHLAASGLLRREVA